MKKADELRKRAFDAVDGEDIARMHERIVAKAELEADKGEMSLVWHSVPNSETDRRELRQKLERDGFEVTIYEPPGRGRHMRVSWDTVL